MEIIFYFHRRVAMNQFKRHGKKTAAQKQSMNKICGVAHETFSTQSIEYRGKVNRECWFRFRSN